MGLVRRPPVVEHRGAMPPRDPPRRAHHDGLLPIDPEVGPSPGRGQDAILGERASRRPRTSLVLAAVALGGALGAPARYGVAQLVHAEPGGFPWPTFWTNVSGSFALGLLLALILERFPPTRYVRAFVATGFLGAYTTYSTFAVETDVLVKDGHAVVALVYAAATRLVGFTAAWAGLWAARTVPVPGRLGRRVESGPVEGDG